MKNIFLTVKQETEKLLRNGKGSHDLEHTQRVLKLALHIGKKEKADLKIIRLAAMLHDVARRDEDKSGGRVDHAALGAKIAAGMLKKAGLNPEKTSAVCHCIETHRFRGVIKPRTKEAKCLFDADKLDSIGAVGIGRAFLFAGEVGAKLHNKGVDISGTRPYTEEDTAYREFMVKLRHVKGRMLTKEGKKLAKQRHSYMKDFFKRLDLETGGKI
jgi:uncharacterized protein